MLLVADDPDFMKIIVAWASLDVRPVEMPSLLQSESDREVWDWLWSNAEYSIADLAERSGLTAPLVNGSSSR